MRKLLGIQVEGNVIILDEAHNSEQVAEDVESFDIEHLKLPKGLVKKLKLGKNLKNGLVSWEVAEKLAQICNAVNDVTNDHPEDRELLDFSLDLQHRTRRLISSNGKQKDGDKCKGNGKVR